MRRNLRVLTVLMIMLLLLCLTGCHEHEWVDATCTAPKTCKGCGKTEGEPLGHTWADATCTEPKTCTVCGETEGEALGDDWQMATCLAPTTCKVCGFVPDETLADHACESWEEEKDPTCTEKGYQKGICKYCGKEFTVELEMVEHDFDEWEVTKEASCSEEGEKTRKCKVCGKEEKESIAKLDHDLNDWEIGEEPSYGHDGTYIRTCKMCRETIETKPYTYPESLADMYSLKGDKEGFTVTDINSWYDEDELFVTTGVIVEITNDGTENLKLDKCRIDYKDDDGKLIGTEDEYTPMVGPQIIAPGEKGYFVVNGVYDNSENELNVDNGLNVFAHITVKQTKKPAVRYEVSDAGYSGSCPDGYGYVTNKTKNDADEVAMISLYRNEDGRVINAGYNWTDGSLPAGETVSFETHCLWYSLENAADISDFETIVFPFTYE